MSNRNYELNVAHTLTTYFFLGNFHAATVADNAFVTNSLIFSAVTFPVFNRTKDTLAEQAAHFRLVRTVVDGFRLGYFTVRTLQDRFRRGQADSNFREVLI